MITLYIIYYSKMCELFLQDDIIDVLKSKIDIRDYDKLKKVSVKYKKIFDLKYSKVRFCLLKNRLLHS